MIYIHTLVVKQYEAVPTDDKIKFSLEKKVGVRYYRPSNPNLLLYKKKTEDAPPSMFQPILLYWKAEFIGLQEAVDPQKGVPSFCYTSSLTLD